MRRFEYHAALDDAQHAFPADSVPNLAAGFVDRAAVDSAQNGREAARSYYQKNVSQVSLALPDELHMNDLVTPTSASWVAIEVKFTLLGPWYSKDDRPFHVLDNPVRKDRVFGVPFMSAASWKGLLRWVCRMEHGLLDHLARHDNQLRGWLDPDWIVHLFGDERGADDGDLSRGALECRPTWFKAVGFEVINPHDRARRAGTQPITYEVVPSGTDGALQLIYAPAPGRPAPDAVLKRLLNAIEKLLTVYGFSAKRTAGWGLASIQSWEIRSRGQTKIGSLPEIEEAIRAFTAAHGDTP